MTETRYNLPPEYHIFERNNRSLIFDPRNFIWFVTDSLGKAAFTGLARAGDADDAASEVAAFIGGGFDSAAIAEYVSKYIDQLLDIGFIHAGEYQEIKWAPSVMDRPKLLYLHLTSKCNLRCPYCYNQEHRFQLVQLGRNKEEVDQAYEGRAADFFKVIDEAAALGFNQIKITGGEALLNKDALSIAERAKSHGMFVNLLTNAILITEEIAKRIAETVDIVSISLDSSHACEHDAVRGEGTHAKVLKAIHVLKEAGVKAVHLNSVVTPVNMDSVEEFLDYAFNDIKANDVTIAGAGMNVDDPSGRWGAADYMLNGEQFRHIYEQERRFHQIRKQTPTHNHVTPHSLLRRTQCGVGNGLVSIESNGDVFPCQTMHSPEFLCGNAFREGLENILQTSGILKTMKSLQVDILPECSTCPVRYVCAGGCRKEALSHEGALTARNRLMCPIYFDQALDRLWDAATIPVERANEAVDSFETHQSCH